MNKTNTNDPSKDAASSSVDGLLEELTGIIASAMDRSGETHDHEIKWLLELPLTDTEYKRLRHIVSSSNTSVSGTHPANESNNNQNANLSKEEEA